LNGGHKYDVTTSSVPVYESCTQLVTTTNTMVTCELQQTIKFKNCELIICQLLACYWKVLAWFSLRTKYVSYG